MPPFPDIVVHLGSDDDNAFHIFRVVTAGMRKAGASEEQIAAYVKEASAGGYENLVDVTRRWATVVQVPSMVALGELSMAANTANSHAARKGSGGKDAPKTAPYKKFAALFGEDGLTIRAAGRVYTVPFFVFALVIAAVSVGAFSAMLHGPWWLAIAAVPLLIGPPVILVGAMIWTSAQHYGPWLVARWHRVGIVAGLAFILTAFEYFNARWPSDGEPIPGYWFGALVATWGALACIFGVRGAR